MSTPERKRSPAEDSRPLTEEEYRLVQRLFSDPFALPAPFKAWLVSYLEVSDMTLPISSINGLERVIEDLSTP